jgi:hypothetical protein
MRGARLIMHRLDPCIYFYLVAYIYISRTDITCVWLSILERVKRRVYK